jgi:hypothetical protein
VYRLATFLVVSSLLWTQPLSATAEGWPWNPFASKSAGAETDPFFAARHESTSSASRSAGPSPIAKLNQGTKRFFGRAKNALSWNRPSSPTPPSNMPYWNPSSSKTKKKSQGSWWTGMWGRKEPKKTETVGDFLDLDRPQ